MGVSGRATELAVISDFVRPPDLPFTCSDEDLLAGVHLWLLGAEDKEVLHKLGVTVRSTTLKHWTSSAGWHYLVDALREPVRQFASGQLLRLGQQVLDQLALRIRDGDPVYDAEHNVVGHKAVRAKDLALIWATLQDRQATLEGRTAEQQETLIDLKDLALGLKRYAQAHEVDGKVIP